MATKSLILVVAVFFAVIVTVTVTIMAISNYPSESSATAAAVTEMKSTTPNQPVITGFSSKKMFSSEPVRQPPEATQKKEKSE